jgi:hypothetical protein
MPRKCPKGTICFENYTIFFICLLLFVVGYCIYREKGCLFCSHVEVPFSLSHNHGHSHSHSQNHSHDHAPPPLIPTSGYDMMRPIARPGISYNNNPSDTLLNPYAPPLQHNSPHTYKQVGYLKNDHYGHKMFPIFAKPIHLRRDKWYYYTIYDNIKLPIYSNGRKCSSEQGCDSLMNGDMVKLENMNDPFQVSLYDNNTLTYDPVL